MHLLFLLIHGSLQRGNKWHKIVWITMGKLFSTYSSVHILVSQTWNGNIATVCTNHPPCKFLPKSLVYKSNILDDPLDLWPAKQKIFKKRSNLLSCVWKTNMDISTCVLIAVWLIAHHPIIIITTNGITNGQRQMIPYIWQLMNRGNIAFLVGTCLKYWNKTIIHFNKWLRNAIFDLATNAFEIEFIAGAILGSIWLDDRFADTFATFIIVNGSVEFSSFNEITFRRNRTIKKTYRWAPSRYLFGSRPRHWAIRAESVPAIGLRRRDTTGWIWLAR